jgi:hypothetical protein
MAMILLTAVGRLVPHPSNLRPLAKRHFSGRPIVLANGGHI